MAEQPRYENYEQSNFFEDGMVARQSVPGTISRDGPLPGSLIRTGLTPEGFLATELPRPLDYELLEQGRQSYEIYCSVCHGRDGYGDGMVVRRGFPRPPSFHEQRLREAPLGYVVHVIQNGYGIMYPYRDRVDPESRWAIAAYIRALQFSQDADSTLLSEEDLSRLGEEPTP